MKSIKDRYWNELWYEHMVNNPTSYGDITQDIFNILNKEYFNNKLEIKIVYHWVIVDHQRELSYSIDNKFFKGIEDMIDYMDRLYELTSIKHKIERIYEIN